MSSLRKRFLPRFVLVLWSFVALIPPGAWVMCFGSQGHVALEIATTHGCGDDSGKPDASACEAASCESCVDVPLLHGLALHHSQPHLDGPSCLPSRDWAVFVPEYRISGASVTLGQHPESSPSTLLETLRC